MPAICLKRLEPLKWNPCIFKIQKERKRHTGNISPVTVFGSTVFNCQPFLEVQLLGNVIWQLLKPEGLYLCG